MDGRARDGWAPKNWCFWTVVLEKTLESTLDCKELKPVNLKGNQPWIFTGRTDAEVLILRPPEAKIRLTGKDPDAGENWKQEEKRDDRGWEVGWHHQFNGHEFEQVLEDGEGQGSPQACCSLWGREKWRNWATEQEQQGKVKVRTRLKRKPKNEEPGW